MRTLWFLGASSLRCISLNMFTKGSSPVPFLTFEVLVELLESEIGCVLDVSPAKHSRSWWWVRERVVVRDPVVVVRDVIVRRVVSVSGVVAVVRIVAVVCAGIHQGGKSLDNIFMLLGLRVDHEMVLAIELPLARLTIVLGLALRNALVLLVQVFSQGLLGREAFLACRALQAVSWCRLHPTPVSAHILYIVYGAHSLL